MSSHVYPKICIWPDLFNALLLEHKVLTVTVYLSAEYANKFRQLMCTVTVKDPRNVE